MRPVIWGLGLIILGLLAFAAYVRLAPADPAQWHVAPPVVDAPPGQVQALTGAAVLQVQGDGAALLAQLDALAMATPRTARLAGDVAMGRITWVTRSALWGFPDYTTAEAREGGVTVYSRLRFGREDMGVNAARLRQWAKDLAD